MPCGNDAGTVDAEEAGRSTTVQLACLRNGQVCWNLRSGIWYVTYICHLTKVRERPFHYLGGGLEELFSADYFFTWCLKLDFFFTHQLKPDFFFTKNWKSDYFFIVMFQVKDIHIIFRVEARLFFLQHIKAKKFFQHTGWAKLFFFGQKQRQIIFSKTLPAPPQIMKWSLPKAVPRYIRRQFKTPAASHYIYNSASLMAIALNKKEVYSH